MSDAVLVEVVRGSVVESRHRGAIAVVDAEGRIALSVGDIERPVFPRSAVKGLQALVLIESGAADRYGLTPPELALACSGTGRKLASHRLAAATRIRHACATHPWFVGGTDRFCTGVMRSLGLRAFVKTGAEGVMCAALPDQGFGIAVKCDDGAGRAAEVVMAALLQRFCGLDDSGHAALERFVQPTLRNWYGIPF